MADDDVEMGNALEGSPDESFEEGKKGKGISKGIVKILTFVAAAIGGIIFIVTTVVITVKIMQKGQQNTQFAQVSEEYENKPYDLIYYDGIGQIRTRTRDKEQEHTVVVSIVIGYLEANQQKVQTELVARQPQLTDLIRNYFSQKSAEELSPEHEKKIKADIKVMINQLMKDGVEEIVFPEFQVYNY